MPRTSAISSNGYQENKIGKLMTKALLGPMHNEKNKKQGIKGT